MKKDEIRKIGIEVLYGDHCTLIAILNTCDFNSFILNLPQSVSEPVSAWRLFRPTELAFKHSQSSSFVQRTVIWSN